MSREADDFDALEQRQEVIDADVVEDDDALPSEYRPTIDAAEADALEQAEEVPLGDDRR